MSGKRVGESAAGLAGGASVAAIAGAEPRVIALADVPAQPWKNGGGLTRENGDRMRKFVLAPGGEIEAGKLFPNFSGYEAKIEPLLEKRGLTSK